MKYILTTLLGLLLISLPARAAEDEARQTVETTAGQMTARLMSDHDLVQRHDYYLEQMVREILLPAIDADYMARRVMGKYWKRTSAEQRQSFMQSFQEKVIRTYAGAFRAYNGEQLHFDDARYSEDGQKAVVKSTIERPGGAPAVNVDYRLYSIDHHWKVYDVVIEGMSLIRSFRDQVSMSIEEDGLAQTISQLAAEYQSDAPLIHLGAHSWGPYLGSNEPEQGLLADLVKTAYRRAGYRVELTFAPANRLRDMISSGSLQGDIAAWPSDAGQPDSLYSAPYLSNQLVFVKRSDDPFRFTDQTSLLNFARNKGYRLGVYSEVDYGAVLQPLQQVFVIAERDYCSQLFRDVAGKSLDLALVDRWAGQLELDSKPTIAQHLTLVSTPLVSRDLHVTIPRSTEQADLLIEAFNTGLRLMKEDGTYQSLLKKHNYSE